MLRSIYIENFRSIRKLNLDLDKINALVGRNNVGKSNIIYAIKLLLDEKWPINSILEEDICNYEEGLKCKIELYFDEPIIHTYYGTELKIGGFRLSFDKSHGASFVGITDTGEEILTQYSKPLVISNEIRSKVPVVYIGIDRDLERMLAPNDWSLFSRILENISNKSNSNGDNDKSEKFKQRISAAMELIKEDLIDIEKDMEGIVKEYSGMKEVSLGLKEPDMRSFFKSLAIHIKENSVFDPAPALSMGTGIQSMIAIALLKSYKTISGSKSILLLEEPEIYLHPHARRYFYGIMDKLSNEDIQVIYTTHSTEFVDVYNFERINIVEKNLEKGTYVNQGKDISIEKGSKEQIKLYTEFDATRNELFFSEKVMLVEGPTEKNALPYLFRLNQIDLHKENISIIDTGGKENILFFAKVLRSFKIPFVVLTDSDSDKTGDYHKNLNTKITEFCGLDTTFFMDPYIERLFNIEVSLRESKLRKLVKIVSNLKEKKMIPETINNAISKLSEL